MRPPLAVLLREGFRWFMERLNEEATTEGEVRLSAAAAVVVSHLQPLGLRSTEVARAMGVTRQHVHATVRELIDAGMVETRPDPTSRRDRRIVPTAVGKARRLRALARMAELEAELGARVGVDDVDRLQDILTRLWSPGIDHREGRHT